MRFGFPGDNLHLENHGVSEESFWPSFTDIMMVIVMVFLLVTVSVILNNWTLISDLKKSISAQEVASSLAKSEHQENQNLSTKLNALSQQFDSVKDEKKTTEQKLVEALLALGRSEKSLEKTTADRDAKQQELESLKKDLLVKEETLATSSKRLDEEIEKLALANKQIDEKTQESNRLNQDIATKTSALISSQQEAEALMESLETIKQEKQQQSTEVEYLKNSELELKGVITALQSDRSSVESKLKQLQEKLQTVSKDNKKEQDVSVKADEKLKLLLVKVDEQKKLISSLEEEKKRLTGDLSEKVDQTEKELTDLKTITEDLTTQLASKNDVIDVLQKERATSETQLLSLKGEYDTLDTKYQKLLQPARSSKGKFVVSVIYKKNGNGRKIRIKESSASSYKTVKKSSLHKILSKLKKKHKENLYLKVIIPKNSGLSYNEAWKFTSNLQRKYDYYFQP